MDGAMMLLLFSAFLVLVIYRMDQNEKKAGRQDDESYKAGFEDGMKWMTERSNNAGNGKSGILRRKK